LTIAKAGERINRPSFVQTQNRKGKMNINKDMKFCNVTGQKLDQEVRKANLDLTIKDLERDMIIQEFQFLKMRLTQHLDQIPTVATMKSFLLKDIQKILREDLKQPQTLLRETLIKLVLIKIKIKQDEK
jgi:hypothetical protein|tara:strand:- start:614 stop:1000 length:387 start_codon:yes stop_codon:yes gene_type:complete